MSGPAPGRPWGGGGGGGVLGRGMAGGGGGANRGSWAEVLGSSLPSSWNNTILEVILEMMSGEHL